MRNNKTGERNNVISVKQGKVTQRAKRVVISGPATVVYSHDKPLSCGAKVWIETTSEVLITE